MSTACSSPLELPPSMKLQGRRWWGGFQPTSTGNVCCVCDSIFISLTVLTTTAHLEEIKGQGGHQTTSVLPCPLPERSCWYSQTQKDYLLPLWRPHQQNRPIAVGHLCRCGDHPAPSSTDTPPLATAPQQWFTAPQQQFTAPQQLA